MAQSSPIVFGVHTIHDAQKEFDFQNAKSVNPCVDAFGLGPREKMCKTCTHLKTRRFARNYYKCDLRRDTKSPKTDHRLFWPSCSKYEDAPK